MASSAVTGDGGRLSLMIGQGDEAAPASARCADQAITELYRLHYTKLVRLALLIVGEVPAAEDVVQDAYVSVYRSWTKLRNTDSAAAFLRAAVVNKARSVLRHRAVVDRNTPQAPQTAPSAEHEALVLLGRSTLVAALSKLSPGQRQVIVLRYYEGLSEAEIAEVLGIRKGSVKSHAARGVATLRAELSGIDGAVPFRRYPEPVGAVFLLNEPDIVIFPS
jgi:RNA polymerase sigma-70 factor (sigma-E family)